MIRMGRGNRDEPENNVQDGTSAPAYDQIYDAPSPVTRGAVSESDSMARDIKEGRLSGFVGHGTTLTGETEFQSMLRVDGHLIGTVSSPSGTLIIGTNGQVDANIAVAAAMINGSVNGDVVASEKLQLGRTARVIGNIQSPRLIIEEGAILEGGCNMVKARETQEEQAVAASSQYEESQPSMQTSLLSDDDDDADSYLADEDEEAEEAEAATV